MKQLLTLFLVFNSVVSFSQDVYYAKKIEYLNGKLISNIQGNYKISFGVALLMENNNLISQSIITILNRLG